MTAHKVYANGKLIEVQDLREIPNVMLVDRQNKEMFLNKGAKIGYPTQIVGVKVVTKSSRIQVCKNGCGCVNWTDITSIPIGTVIAETTGDFYSYGCLFSHRNKLKALINLGGSTVKAGDLFSIYNEDTQISYVAGTQATGAGFPMQQGSRGSSVVQLQNYLKSCGISLGSWGADGDWGGATTQAIVSYNSKNPQYRIPSTINSQAELNVITSRSCPSNVPASTGNTGNTGNTNTGNTNTGNTSTGNNPPKDTTIPDIVTPPPAQDNTLLYGVGAVALLMLFGKKKKGKKR